MGKSNDASFFFALNLADHKPRAVRASRRYLWGNDLGGRGCPRAGEIINLRQIGRLLLSLHSNMRSFLALSERC